MVAKNQIEMYDKIEFDSVRACIARPLKSAENKDGRPMVASTSNIEVKSKI